MNADGDPMNADEVAVVVAMALLGPAGPPPPELRAGLLELWRSHEEPPATERLEEFAIAFGCGFGRVCLPGRAETWHHRWPNAVWALRRAAVPAVRRVDEWL